MTRRCGVGPWPRRAGWLALPLVALLAACTGGAGDPAGSSEAAASRTPPPGYRTHTVAGLTFSAPADWQPAEPQQPATSSGPARLALRAPGPDGAPAPVALALVASEPTRDAEQEADALVTITRDVRKAQDVRREAVALEGLGSATLVSYAQSDATGGPQRTDVLIADLPDGSLATLTVIADPAAFDDQELGAIALSARAGAEDS